MEIDINARMIWRERTYGQQGNLILGIDFEYPPQYPSLPQIVGEVEKRNVRDSMDSILPHQSTFITD